jgi:hypothetical protein
MNVTSAHQSETKRPADEPSEASEAGLRSRRKQTKAEHRACQASGCGVGMGGIIPGGALAERLLEAELTQRAGAFSCAKGTNNGQIEDERTRRGGRAVEAGGLVGGRGGVLTGKAQPPRGGPDRGGRPTTGSSSSAKTAGTL